MIHQWRLAMSCCGNKAEKEAVKEAATTPDKVEASAEAEKPSVEEKADEEKRGCGCRC